MVSTEHEEWYGPDRKWPRHGKPWFRAALARARAAGWYLKASSGRAHIFGTVYCRPTADGSGCRMRIYSSGEGGETAAGDLVKLIERCVHLPANQAATLGKALSKIDKVERLLAGAERLIDASDSQMEATEAWGRATDLLDYAEEGTSEVEALMERAAAAEAAAEVALADAVEALRSIHAGSQDAAALVDQVEDLVTQLRADLKQLRSASVEVVDLTARVGAARSRLAGLRGRLPAD